MSERNKKSVPTALPDYYVTVAEDVLRYCRPEPGLWMDLGSGSGGLGLALARASTSIVLLVDPNADALSKALEEARDSGLADRAVPIVAPAEGIPLPDACVEAVASRGSIFFWKDPPQGLREVYRILRPGGRAMIGGGFGTAYPEWAREEFFRRSHGPGGLEAQGEEAVRKWNEPRRPEWLTAHARAAGIETALIEPIPPGRWLLFEKGRDL